MKPWLYPRYEGAVKSVDEMARGGPTSLGELTALGDAALGGVDTMLGLGRTAGADDAT